MGGHVEGKFSALESAKKEVLEETGLESATSKGIVHHLGVYVFPEKADKNQPEHMHYDVCFLFEADLAEKPNANSESKAVRWFTVKEAYQLGDDAVKAMIEKL